MRGIERTGQFKRDFKRESKGRHRSSFSADLSELLKLLANDEKLPERYQDHPLSGDWSDHRDCHLKPDLVLIYRRPDDETLQLVRVGSHSELGF